MKNIFDLNTKTDQYDGNVFCTKNVSPDIARRSEEIMNDLFEIEETPSQSWWFIIIDCICTLLIAIGAVVLINLLFEKEYTLILAFQERPVILSIGLVSAVVLVFLKIKEKREEKESKEKRTQKEITDEKLFSELDELSERAHEQANIPQGSFTIEVISDSYEIKDDKKKLTMKYMSMNLPMDAYVRDNAFCIFDGGQELAIPIRDMKKIEYVKKRKRLVGWFKQVSYKDKKYKKYKVKEFELGITVPGYYRIEIQSVWGEYEIQVPNYDEPVIEMLKTLLAVEKTKIEDA